MEKMPENAEKYVCEKCHFKCCKKSNYDKHLSTPKHIKLMSVNEQLIQNTQLFICRICSKEYKSNVGLWKHKKTCVVIPSPPILPYQPFQFIYEENLIIKTLVDENKELINDNKDFKNLILEMMKSNTDLQKQNQEFQEKMLEVCKNSNTTINNNTKTKNSHNKTFNMQIFLNEHCKDAMNIKDFADSFKLEISDFEKVGHLGYVDGISDIIIKKLNEMDVCKRPIHCSDTKRDIMYVHADNIWVKENSDHDQVRLLVQRITAKNIRLIPIWQDLYPNSRNNMHKLNDTYMSLTRQAMGGFGGTIPENESKIIRKIAKSVFIDKNM
jgi:hypothetical protein